MKTNKCMKINYYIYFEVIIPFLFFFMIILNTNTQMSAQSYSRGIGIYPGDAKEDFSPSIKVDKKNYRNIALLKPVYSSGSYDFNLTAQLITDGIIETEMPGWIVTTTSNGVLSRNEREYFIDRHTETRKIFQGNKLWVQTELAGNYVLPDVDGFKLSGSVSIDTLKAEINPWQITVSASIDGKNWVIIGTLAGQKTFGDTLTGIRRTRYPSNYRIFSKVIKLSQTVRYKFYRAEFNSPDIETWRISEFAMTNNSNYCEVGGPYNFSSAWKSISSKNEWVYIDLGAKCSFDKIKLYWLKRAAAGRIQVSDNSKMWTDISPLPISSSMIDELKLPKPAAGRYVRLMLDKAESDEDGFILSEMEVYGYGGTYAAAHPQANIGKDGCLKLAGGAWKLQRQSLVKETGDVISKLGYDDNDWVIATVPGTVLTSYLNAGMIPDPNYSDNQFLISDSYFYSDFIYRDEFTVPESFKGKRVFLNFNGINWKANVYLNGKEVGRIEGAFTRGKFDVTGKLLPGKRNAIAVYIYKNDAPGFVKEPMFQNHDVNGGELGLDNPTFHASVGWDWMPSIRGRNIGIWNDVFFSTCEDVTIEDPFVTAKLPLPDTDFADLKVQLKLTNHKAEKISGEIKGQIGELKFELPVSLLPSESKVLKLDPSTLPALHLKNPKLWWPNGYGKQNLYDVKLEFISSGGIISDSKGFKTGIREMAYSVDGGVLRIWVNGKRFIARGGNWGFSESNLRYRTREFNIAIRYQKEMNLNMLRNWVGQTGDDEFYNACDKYGIMVWQDFWLANPGDGPNPEDNKMFMQNAEDYVRKIRNHPSIALYCGRNEGFPPDSLDKSLREMLSDLTPEVHYISNSYSPYTSGGGPYSVMPVKYYFGERATPMLHSELGLPSPASLDSFKKMVPDSMIWPINRLWAIHDFCMESAQDGQSYIKMMEDYFGHIDNAKDWFTLAQWISYQGYRAMLEAQSKNRMGVLIWMTHQAWPSFVYQTYDYYFEPTAAYFGCRKGSEPLHIQWNAFSDSIEVVNYSSSEGTGLKASVEILNIDGSVQQKKQFEIDCPIDQVKHIYKLENPESLSSVFFIRLKLEKEGKLISENFYWNGLKDGNVQAIRNLPKVKLDAVTNSVKQNGKLFLTTELMNSTKTPALMVKLKVIGAKDKERLLPVIFSDNYISLMPGEKKIIKMEMENSDTRGDKPEVITEGINIE